MIIQCTNCKAKFRISDSKLKGDSIKARCAKCEQIFVAKVGENAFKDIQVKIRKPGLDPSIFDEKTPPPEDFQESKDFPLFDTAELSVGDITSTSIPSSDSPSERKKEAMPVLPLVEESSQEKAPEEFPDTNTANLPRSSLEEPLEGEVPPSIQMKEISSTRALAKIELKKIQTIKGVTRSRGDYTPKKWFSLVYPLIIALSLSGGLLLTGLNFPFKNLSLLEAKVPKSIKKGLTLIELDSDYVPTAAGFSVFVINGKLYNNSSLPRAKIIVEGQLYSDGNIFLSKEKFSCCTNFSKLSVHEISSMDSLLLMYKKDQVEELKPFTSLPFTLVFKKPEEPVKSFIINILDE